MTYRSRSQRFGKKKSTKFKGFLKLTLLITLVVFIIFIYRTANLITVLQGKEGYFQRKAENLETYLIAYTTTNGETNKESLQTIFILSVDKEGAAYFLDIPSNTRVDSNMEKVLLSDLYSEKGVQGLLEAIETLLNGNLSINNYLIIKEDGLLTLVDKLKGVTIADLPKTYTLGNTTYYAGYNRNFDRTRVQHFFGFIEENNRGSYTERQIIVLQSLFEQYLKFGKALSLVSGISSLDNIFITDMTIRDLAWFRNMLDDVITRESYTTTIPGKTEMLLDKVWIVNTESLNSVINNIKFGQPIVDKTSMNLEILNGNGKSGIAAKYGRIIETLGYTNISTGNADNYNYPKTIIRYPQGYRFLAEEIALKLNVEGNLIEDEINNKIIVIIGKDLD
ncbi:transcriptional attenuator, LytR family [Anaerobranca californiensis DSM 14826]|uniref:Transcriptional attenuator, LytR family n=1 Tax=Anaerobranca californiensis DSM 14826 TaxID=1120989 RepID=A0A1M6NHC9_9FIRM|nr:LCP family protein [Anaerobranca californiensis]SHJ95036.1 transcriptional attenuator, LytR family [Anaerobranca californiensis DSM 14826]